MKRTWRNVLSNYIHGIPFQYRMWRARARERRDQ